MLTGEYVVELETLGVADVDEGTSVAGLEIL